MDGDRSQRFYEHIKALVYIILTARTLYDYSYSPMIHTLAIGC